MSEQQQSSPTTENLKELGNAAVKNNKFEEAILHYTHAIKRDPKNFALFSNRSFAFLKMQQYALAMEDAIETIRLNPTWAKGYFRKGEIEFNTYQYEDAKLSYENALRFKPDDNNIYDAIERTNRAKMKELKADEQIPWLGSGVGIVIGVTIVIADYIFTNSPTHPLVMAFVTIAIALAGYGVAKMFRYYVKSQRNSLLQPINCFGDEEEEEDKQPTENGKTDSKARYTKSQARQRFKKGKM